MPCPFFEPLRVAEPATYRNARLPLIEEYEGRCHLRRGEDRVDPSIRLLGCNHGDLQKVCPDLADYRNSNNEIPALLRFSVQKREAERLEIAVIEEENFVPTNWRPVQFVLAQQAFEPELENPCQRAQLLAFCRSYLARNPL